MSNDSLIFTVDGGVAFTAQIPDDAVGCSGSRCANCKSSTAYCVQICPTCGLPFVGPSGFPQWSEWVRLNYEDQKNLLIRAFRTGHNRGRHRYSNVANIPMTDAELREVERLEGSGAVRFSHTHGVSPQNLKHILVF